MPKPEFVELVFKELDMELEWNGQHEKEHAIEKKSGKTLVCIDPKYFRPTEVDVLQGDASKAKNELGWQASISFEELVKIMVNAEINSLSQSKF